MIKTKQKKTTNKKKKQPPRKPEKRRLQPTKPLSNLSRFVTVLGPRDIAAWAQRRRNLSAVRAVGSLVFDIFLWFLIFFFGFWCFSLVFGVLVRFLVFFFEELRNFSPFYAFSKVSEWVRGF